MADVEFVKFPGWARPGVVQIATIGWRWRLYSTSGWALTRKGALKKLHRFHREKAEAV